VTDSTWESEVAAAFDRNFAEILAWYASWPGGELVRDSDVWRCWTGVPTRIVNAAVYARFEPSNVERRVRDVVDWFESRQQPWRWVVGSGSMPADVEQHLERAGLELVSDNPTLAVNIRDVAWPPDVAGLSVEPLRNEADLDAWAEVNRRGLGRDAVTTQAWREAHRRPGFAEDETLITWLGRIDGEPVAASALFDAYGIAGVQNVVTVPEARGRGIGKQMTAHVLREAERRGHEVAALGSSDMGYPVYRALGFRDVGYLRSWSTSREYTAATGTRRAGHASSASSQSGSPA
jgi:GNAT superfamily N-acetyltransferase